MDCAFIGDSIAVGLQQVQPDCAVHAKVGAGSDFILTKNYGTSTNSYVVISMGSNWPNNPRNRANAIKLRKSIKTELVVWILPYNRTAATTMRAVAQQFQDNYVDLNAFPSKDHVHPSSYRKVNREVQDGVNYYFD